MPTYSVKSRKTMPIVTEEIDAPSREQAIALVANSGEEGESIEVMNVQELEAVVATPSKK